MVVEINVVFVVNLPLLLLISQKDPIYILFAHSFDDSVGSLSISVSVMMLLCII